MNYLTYLTVCAVVLLCATAGCQQSKNNEQKSGQPELFGEMPDGRAVYQYTLTNANGLKMKVINYGGIITSLMVPDKNGEMGDIVLGHNDLKPYLNRNPHFGVIVGRYGNRIANAKFMLDSMEIQLTANDSINHLHGGDTGFGEVFWEIEEVDNPNGTAIQLIYTSIDGEEGYPGNLDVVVRYMLNDDNSLVFDYKATSDKKTIVNLTQHSYFNLSAMKSDILGHELVLNADHYLPVDPMLIPYGELALVEGTPFDFRVAKVIGQEIDANHEQITNGKGYDHNWVFNEGDSAMKFGASLYDPESGRFMELYTTEPGVQFYSGNFLRGNKTGKNGEPYVFRSGLCLETQHFPNSPNEPDFPSVVLEAGEKYHTRTVHRFSVK